MKLMLDGAVTHFNKVLLCCQNSAVAKVHQEQWVRNILLVDVQGHGNNFLARQFCHLTTVYRLKKYEYPQLAPTVSVMVTHIFVVVCGFAGSCTLMCVAGTEG
jgi:hypothetical protein